MALLGMLVNSGISYCNSIRNNLGYFIYPTKVGVSATAGALTVNRTLNDRNSEWYIGAISGYNPINTNGLELITTIPPNSNGGVQTQISELYYYAESESSLFSVNTSTNELTLTDTLIVGLIATGDRVTIRKELLADTMPSPLTEVQTYYARKISSLVIKLYNTEADAIADTNVIDLTTTGTGNLKLQKEFFLAIAQPTPAIEYLPDMGSYDLRPSMILANVGDTSLFQFIYTQSFDIETHNNDETAHPAIQSAMNKAGQFVMPSQHDYKGQSHDEYPVFESGVNNNKPVYKKTNNEYGLAQADGTIKELNFVGFRQDNMVKTNGYLNIGTHGFAVGSKVYLSPSVAGNLTTTSNNTEVGIVINSNTILLKKQYIPNIPVVGNTVNIQDEGSFVDAASTLNFVGAIVTASGGGGIVNVTLASTFTALTDTPANYAGHGNKVVRVNALENALTFSDYKDTFISLTDTPANYVNAENKYIKVNSLGTALEFTNQISNESDIWFMEGNLGAGFTLIPDRVNDLYIGNSTKLIFSNTGNNGAILGDFSLLNKVYFETGDVIKPSLFGLGLKAWSWDGVSFIAEPLTPNSYFIRKIDNQTIQLYKTFSGAQNDIIINDKIYFSDNSTGSPPTIDAYLNGVFEKTTLPLNTHIYTGGNTTHFILPDINTMQDNQIINIYSKDVSGTTYIYTKLSQNLIFNFDFSSLSNNIWLNFTRPIIKIKKLNFHGNVGFFITGYSCLVT